MAAATCSTRSATRSAVGSPAGALATAARSAVEEGDVGLLALDAATHVEAEDVVGSLPERVDLRVAQDARDRPVLDVAVAAVHLDGVARRRDPEPRGPQLDERGADAQPVVGVVAVEHEGLGRLDVDDHLGELALHERMLGERLAEGVACPGVAERLDEGPTGAAEAHHGDAEPGAVRHLHHPGEALAVAGAGLAAALAGEQERLGVDELDLGRRHRLRAELVLEPADADARCGCRRAARRSTRNVAMPRALSGAPSGLASTTHASPLAFEANHLKPLMRHASPSGVAVVSISARSEPPVRSVRDWIV